MKYHSRMAEIHKEVIMTVSLAPRGRTFVRGLIAQNQARANPYQYAAQRWGEALAKDIAKAAVPASVSGDFGDPAAREFFGEALKQSLIGKMTGTRQVPFNVRMLNQTQGATGYWAAEGKPIPLSHQTVSGTTLEAKRVGAIVATTQEAVKAAGIIAEAALHADIQNAVAAAMDQAFIDPANAGGVEIPASITNGATSTSSGGDIKGDIKTLFAGYAGQASTANLVMNPATAVAARIDLDDGAFGPNGGQLFGIPVVCSESVPADMIALVDGAAIAYAGKEFEMSQTEEAALEMLDDSLVQDGTDGTGTTMVNLWQTDTVAWMATGRANWEAQGSDRVTVITDVDYS